MTPEAKVYSSSHLVLIEKKLFINHFIVLKLVFKFKMRNYFALKLMKIRKDLFKSDAVMREKLFI